MEKPEVEHSVSKQTRLPENDPHVYKELMVAFSRALKNYAIYPSDHVICRNAVADFEKKLGGALSEKDLFRIDVEKDRLLHDGALIYQSTAREGDLPHILFRDGIQWIAFESGIDTEEILRFLEILHRHRHLKEETEGDIVTALWDAGLTHLHYDAADVLWDAEPLIDFGSLELEPPSGERKSFSSGSAGSPIMEEEKTEDPPSAADLQTGPMKEGTADEEAAAEAPIALEPLQDQETLGKSGQADSDGDRKSSGVAAYLETQGEVLSIAAPEIDRDLWKLTEAEQNELRKMVIEEENWDSIDDVLDVLVVILQEQQTEADFSTILEFITEEFQMTLEELEFQLAVDLLDTIEKLKRTYTDPEHWAPPLLDRFFQTISGPEILDPLGQCPSELAKLSDERLKTMRRLLLHLHPRAVHPLGLMLPGMSDPRIRKVLMEVIGSLANTDPFSLEKLLENSDEELVQQIVFILGHLKHPDSVPLLTNMLSHSSASIRKQAMKAVLSRGSGALPKIFPLIEDPSPEIRQIILELLSRRRSREAESLLLEYLSDGRFKIDEPLHVIACYYTLGQCGSFQSIPFLRARLLEKGWRGMIGLEKPHERQGAAMALMALKLETAEEILQQAARNRFPSIRRAYENAFEALR
jgi:hypothetical protein